VSKPIYVDAMYVPKFTCPTLLGGGFGE